MKSISKLALVLFCTTGVTTGASAQSGMAEFVLYRTPSGWSSLVLLAPSALFIWLTHASGTVSDSIPQEYLVRVVNRNEVPGKGVVLVLGREPFKTQETTYPLVLPKEAAEPFHEGDKLILRLDGPSKGTIRHFEGKNVTPIPSQSFSFYSFRHEPPRVEPSTPR